MSHKNAPTPDILSHSNGFRDVREIMEVHDGEMTRAELIKKRSSQTQTPELGGMEMSEIEKRFNALETEVRTLKEQLSQQKQACRCSANTAECMDQPESRLT